MWVVQEPGQVREVFSDPDRFSPANALTAHTPLGIPALRILSAVGFTLPPALANNDTVTHRAIRRAVARFFSPARVDAVEPLTRTLNKSRLTTVRARLADGAEADLVSLVASDVPALVLLELLGMTEVDVAALKRWSIDSLELFWGRPTPERQEQLAASAAEFYAWLRLRATAARSSPRDDLLGRLVQLGLTDAEICSVAYFLLIAGHETTSQLISAAYQRLIADPDRWRAIGADPRLAGPAVEEMLAKASSVPTWRRVATRDTTVGDTIVPANAPLLLQLTGTSGSGDLAFGVGTHRCLGAHLSRMETRVAIQEAATALPELRLSDLHPPEIDLLSFRAPRHVLVR